MRPALVQAVRQQFGFRCGYCDVTEVEAGATLTVDHYHPRKRGGVDDFDNLVYCCHACNEHKGYYGTPTRWIAFFIPCATNSPCTTSNR